MSDPSAPRASGKAPASAGSCSANTTPFPSHTTTSSKKKKGSYARVWLDEWKKGRESWLIYDVVENKMYCGVCRLFKMSNTFAVGTSTMKSERIRNHERLPKHVYAIKEAGTDAENLQAAIRTQVVRERTGILNLMTTAYTLAKCDTALYKFRDLLHGNEALFVVDDCRELMS
jgi:hypothetical protein